MATYTTLTTPTTAAGRTLYKDPGNGGIDFILDDAAYLDAILAIEAEAVAPWREALTLVMRHDGYLKGGSHLIDDGCIAAAHALLDKGGEK